MTLVVEFEHVDQLPAMLEQFALRTANAGLTMGHETFTTHAGLRVAVMRHRARPSTSRVDSALSPTESG